MPTASGAHGQRRGSSSPPPSLAPDRLWRRVFPGHAGELSVLRRWLAELLPPCAARDDVAAVATELASNAVKHTRSGRGGWFAVEVTWHPQAVRVAVADCGGPLEPRVLDDPAAEHGRGLLIVRGLSVRTGMTGDWRGRLVWADVAWPDQGARFGDFEGPRPGRRQPVQAGQSAQPPGPAGALVPGSVSDGAAACLPGVVIAAVQARR
jgi:serine/threonine-protein kinase RsbW